MGSHDTGGGEGVGPQEGSHDTGGGGGATGG